MKFSLKNALYAGAAAGLATFPAIASATLGNPFERGQTDLGTAGTAAGISGGTTDLYAIVGRIINVVLGFLGIVLLFYFIYGGFKWMTAGGDSKGVDEAKKMIQNAVIGLVIIMASYALSNFVLSQLLVVTSAT